MDAPPGVPPAVAEPGAEDSSAVGVPPVVVVVVTHDAGPWLEEALGALGAQDYPNLSVLVVDAASAEDPTPRIAAALPSAYVRRLETNAGYGPTANQVLEIVDGASHYLFMHDDAAPDPDAVRLLVEEAFRSNAGIVAPKLVEWDDPTQLMAVGAAADKTGFVIPYGRGELDQEQHDAVRDVFVAPGAMTLVRADLFDTLAGFDPGLAMFGEDLDLCWRAHVVGARVVVAPAARVRHRQATVAGERLLEPAWSSSGRASAGRMDDASRLRLRHRVRTVLKSYGLIHLIVILPQFLILTLGEAGVAMLSGRRADARARLDALRWTASVRSELRAARRVVQGQRSIRDHEIRGLQSRGRDRLVEAVRTPDGGSGVAAAGRRVAGAVNASGARQRLMIWLSVAAVLVIGSRQLLVGALPSVGQLAPFPDSPGTFLRLFGSGWRTSGLGSEAPAPFAFALLGMGGMVLLGGMGLLQKILVLGAIPLGIVGAQRLAAPVGSWRGRLVGGVLYAANPLPYDALARGRWSGLVAYAAAPWLLARLLRATGLEPFGAPRQPEPVVAGDRGRSSSRPEPSGRGDGPALLGGGDDDSEEGAARSRHPTHWGGSPRPSAAVEELLGADASTVDPIATEEYRVAAVALAGRRRSHPPEGTFTPRPPGSLGYQTLAAGLILAVSAAFVPLIVPVVLLATAGLVVSATLLGEGPAMRRAMKVAGGAALGAAVLLLPWTLELVLPGATWAGIAGLGAPASDAPGLGEVLHFATGPMGASPLTWGFPLVAALPLVLARRWRFAWAARLWIMATALGAGAWLAGRGWLGLPPPPLDVILAPAAAALVLAAVLGLAAFETDLKGYRFGIRQFAFVFAVVAGLGATLPAVLGAIDGRWNMPSRNFAGLLSWLPERQADGAFRVLWTGAPDLLPLDGWALEGGLAYGTSRGGLPEATDLWPPSDQGATGLLADSLSVARRGETSSLGHLLAPMGVRYIAVPLDLAPSSDPVTTSPDRPLPDDLLAGLRAQTDLKLIQTGGSLIVYENAAWAPARSVLPAAAELASRDSGVEAGRTANLAGASPVLAEEAPTRFRGPWPGGELYVAETYSSRWRFEVDGETATHRKAFGWAQAFSAPAGEGSLRYRTSPLRYLAILVQLGLWVAAVRFGVLEARRRRGSLPSGAVSG